MTKKICLLKNAVFAASLILTSSAFAVTFPTTPKGMIQKTNDEMKAYPDVKVVLGQPLPFTALNGKTETELSLMRNSIYAQAHLKFTEAWLKDYFANRSWYKAGVFQPKVLAKVDFDNAKMIYDFEKNHKMLTVVREAQTHRAVAQTHQPEASNMSTAQLKAAVLGARYCNLYDDGAVVSKLTFHHDMKVDELDKDPSDVYGSAYGDAYGADGSAYGDAYSANADAADGSYGSAYVGPHAGGEGNLIQGTWSLVDHHVQIKTGGSSITLYFGQKNFAQHRCFTNAKDIF